MNLFVRLFTIFSSISSIHTFSMKPMTKQHVVFFPARFQQQLPGEMYNGFVTKMKEKYEVHIAGNNVAQNEKLLSELQDKCEANYDNLGFISHSSGVKDLWNIYDVIQKSDRNVKIDKIVLIEPLDFEITSKFNVKNYIPFSSLFDIFDFSKNNIEIGELNNKIEKIIETDYVELLKTTIWGKLGYDSVQSCEIEYDDNDTIITNTEMANTCKLLVVKHELSDKWMFIPTVPPLSVLGLDLEKFQKSMTVKEMKIKKYSHFDILDRPWANLMNRATLNKRETSSEELSEYIETLGKMIDNFYIQNI